MLFPGTTVIKNIKLRKEMLYEKCFLITYELSIKIGRCYNACVIQAIAMVIWLLQSLLKLSQTHPPLSLSMPREDSDYSGLSMYLEVRAGSDPSSPASAIPLDLHSWLICQLFSWVESQHSILLGQCVPSNHEQRRLHEDSTPSHQKKDIHSVWAEATQFPSAQT